MNQYEQRRQEIQRERLAARETDGLGGPVEAKAVEAVRANTEALKQCAALINFDAVPDAQLVDLIQVYLRTGQLQQAFAATDRSLGVEVPGPERARRLVNAAQVYANKFPVLTSGEQSDASALAQLKAVVAELDRLPDASVVQRINAKYGLLSAIDDVTDVKELETQIVTAREILALRSTLKPEELSPTVQGLNQLLSWLGHIYADAGDVDSAIEYMTRAAEAAPTAVVRWWPETALTRLRLVGKPAPAIEAPYWLNAPASQRRYAPTGKVSVLVFTVHACGPCKPRYPGVVRLHDKYRAQGVEFVTVIPLIGAFYGEDSIREGISEPEEVEANRKFYVEKYGFRMPIAVDKAIPAEAGVESRSRTEQQYGIEGYPVFVVIGRDGIVRAAQRLGPGTADARLEAEIRAALTAS